jgi:hypothetical protein
MEKKFLDLTKKANRPRNNRGKGGKIVIMVINTGTAQLADKLEAGVDYTFTLDGSGNASCMCQKWTRDDSDATPVKAPDGPAEPLVFTDAITAALGTAINGILSPAVQAQFGAEEAAISGTANITPVVATIQLGVPVKDGNATAPGANYPLTIVGGTGTNAVVLQYSTDGKTWNNFGSASNVPDGTTPLDTPNPANITGATQIQAVLTVGGVTYTSNAQPVNY